MSINSINSVSSLSPLKGLQSEGIGKPEGGESSFASYLNKSFNDVNDLLQASDKKNVEIAAGRSENLHDAMITFEKAETALKLLMQVRNKAMDAYHEIIRMQV